MRSGRRMSRTRARKSFTVRDLERQTQGVECRKDRRVLDELPGAYKDIKPFLRRTMSPWKPFRHGKARGSPPGLGGTFALPSRAYQTG